MPEEPLEWLIVGGGIHGVHVAARLIGEAEVCPESLAIVDPAPSLLARWRECTRTTGMTHLRSPAVHHLDLQPWSLHRFAGKKKKHRTGLLAAPYDRPSLDLFDQHCNRVLDRYGLRSLHRRARVEACRPGRDMVELRLDGGQVQMARRVVLAIGVSEQPAWPDWAPRDDPRVRHIFAPSFELPERKRGEVFLVVGGGISAAQMALRLVDEGVKVELVSRHQPRVHQFDSDPGWLGPRKMPIFQRERCPDRRRFILTQARHRGSVPPAVNRRLAGAEEWRVLNRHQAEVRSVETTDQGVALELADGEVLTGHHLLLATGFEPRRPGGPLVDDLVEKEGFRVAKCGFPIVDRSLRWHPRVFVTGALAELELGPVSRNIAGARRAADRLVAKAMDAAPDAPAKDRPRKRIAS